MNRMIDRYALTAIAPLGLFLLAGCQPEQPASGPARFDGVAQANVSAFNSTSDRCTYSFLFDNFRVEWRPAAQPQAGQAKTEAERSFTLAASPGARGKTARFDLRGSYMFTGPAPTVTASINIAGKDHAITLAEGDGMNEFYQRFEAVVPDDAELIPVKIRTAIAKPESPETEALIDIDSVDLVLVAPDCSTSDEAPKAAPVAPANSS